MSSTEIDDALSSERRIEPSAAFKGEVMRAVHARAAMGRPRDRVWRAVWPAVAAASVMVALLGAVMLLERSEPQPAETSEVARWLLLTLTGTFAIAWRSTRRER